jgi:acetyl-CoA carboxylase biotin carboxyl carrier protein
LPRLLPQSETGQVPSLHRIQKRNPPYFMNQKELKELIEFLIEKDIAEFELERGDVKVKVKRGAVALATPAPEVRYATPPVASSPRAAASIAELKALESPAPAATPEPEEKLHIVKSPIVGTFYEAPSPGAPPFVKVGDLLEVGQILCIVEAMKLMNEIECDAAGELIKKLVTNGQPIEYGQELFVLRPK